jgi:hypothetical protein
VTSGIQGEENQKQQERTTPRSSSFFGPSKTTKLCIDRRCVNAFSRLFLSFLYASLRSLSPCSLVSFFRSSYYSKNLISNELASSIDDRRCFCSRGGRHFDTPVAQQRSHTRKPFEFFFGFGQISQRNIERCRRRKKKRGERQDIKNR